MNFVLEEIMESNPRPSTSSDNARQRIETLTQFLLTGDSAPAANNYDCGNTPRNRTPLCRLGSDVGQTFRLT
ncbi:MAG: hypothetical protein LBD89_09445 [Tannerellaceae bacterium]|nr:hypothetical protein [Tannerellaceae bacterium]